MCEVPTVVPDIPVIHRVLPKFFASPTRTRRAWSLGDRDGGPGLPKSQQWQAGAAGDQRSDLRRQAMLKFLREVRRGQLGRGAGRGDRLSRDAVLKGLRIWKDKAGRKSGYPKKGRGTSGCFDFGQAGQVEGLMILRVVDR